MGYWNGTADGASLQLNDTGIIWGDAPADIMDDALEAIFKVFREDWGREPTLEEVIAGVKFSWPGE